MKKNHIVYAVHAMVSSVFILSSLCVLWVIWNLIQIMEDTLSWKMHLYLEFAREFRGFAVPCCSPVDSK